MLCGVQSLIITMSDGMSNGRQSSGSLLLMEAIPKHMYVRSAGKR